MPPTVKPGIKTTEFWLTAAGIAIPAALAILQLLDAGWAVTSTTILTGLYSLLRFATKNKTPTP